MFSITMMAASTSKPRDNKNAKSVILLMVCPLIYAINSVIAKMAGTVKVTIIDSFHPSANISMIAMMMMVITRWCISSFTASLALSP